MGLYDGPWNVVLWHRGSKCSGAKGKESDNKITGFVTPQIYREANSFCVCERVKRLEKGEES